jgi:hypothetical protein
VPCFLAHAFDVGDGDRSAIEKCIRGIFHLGEKDLRLDCSRLPVPSF